MEQYIWLAQVIWVREAKYDLNQSIVSKWRPNFVIIIIIVIYWVEGFLKINKNCKGCFLVIDVYINIIKEMCRCGSSWVVFTKTSLISKNIKCIKIIHNLCVN